MTECQWQHFEHGADIGILGRGVSPAEAFAHTAQAATAVITDLDLVAPNLPIEIHCQAPDLELLLCDWINALIFEMATRNMLFSRFQVAIDNNRLSATAWGEVVDPPRHQPAVEIKGATYTELKVTQQDDHWLAQCVVDV